MKLASNLLVHLIILVLLTSASASSSLRGLQVGNGFGGDPLPQVSCRFDNDCPQVQCIVEPCDQYSCDSNGLCAFTTSDRNDDPASDISSNSTLIDTGVPCGPTQCAQDEVCCNESCGTCTPVGGVCSDMFCLEEGDRNDDPASDISSNGTLIDTEEGEQSEEQGEVCGPATCSIGEVCCNRSCGICTQVGGACSKQMCDIPEDAGAEEESQSDDGSWAHVTQGECECQALCSVCRNFFGVCVQLYCFN